MSDLMLPMPSNVVTRNRMAVVDSDLFNIAQRVREVDPNLVLLLDERNEKPWVVMERGADGVERFVKRYSELDNRIVEDLKYMLAVPLNERMERVNREIEQADAERQGLKGEKFEQFAHDFMEAGKKSGIIDPNWSRSYRKVKVKK
jgi:hypothetical protein